MINYQRMISVLGSFTVMAAMDQLFWLPQGDIFELCRESYEIIKQYD